MQIRPVHSRRDVQQFIELPARIYADDPYWVEPLHAEVREFLDPNRHPFYNHGSAQPYLALRGDEVVGRILVSDDPHYNREREANLGTFGMFECQNDPEAATALFETAAAWCRNRDRTAIWGPIDYSTNYPCGLLIDGFASPPRVMMNHNPPYYQQLFEGWGLAKAKDLYAWWFVDADGMLDKWRVKAERLAKRGSVQIRSARIRNFDQEIKRLEKLYNESWESNWGFTKMSPDEFKHLGKKLKQILIPELVLIAEVAGEPVGFAITLPDVNEAIQPLRGRLWKWGLPIGAFQLFRNLKRVHTCRLVTLGVVPKYRRRGVAELLILDTLDRGKNKLGFNAAELGWTLEDNALINNTIEAVGGTRYKTYRIFEKSIV